MNKELSTELSMFFGEVKADLRNVIETQNKQSDKLEEHHELLIQLANTEKLMTEIIEQNSNQTKTIKKLSDKVEEHDRVIKNIKWAFGIVTVIFVGVATAFFKGMFGI